MFSYKLIRFFLPFLMSFLPFIYAIAQDYTLPLTANPSLFSTNESSIKPKTNSGGETFDSTFYFVPDTLTLPIFDEFSSNNFQFYEADYDDPNIQSEIYYRLLDEETEVPLPDNSIFSDEVTYRLEINLIDDTIIRHNFDSTVFLFSSLNIYPVEYESTFGYPPYLVIDTVGVEEYQPDTIMVDDPTFIQDSARIFISELVDDSKLWLNHQAYHNYRFAKSPWSLGVVTFDGLDEHGYPYLFGSTMVMTCDTLLSKPIDMSLQNTQDSVYFSFLYQPEGYGDVPEEVDSLYLDFYNPIEERWNRIWATGGKPVTDFKAVHIPVINPAYFNKGFQFRFMNFGSPAGALDHFHIDYVNLRPFSGYQDTLFKDFAFVYPISTLLKDYLSVPWKHYRANPTGKMSDEVEVRVRNGSELPENNQNGSVVITLDDDFQGSFTLNATLLSGGNINYEPRTSYTSLHDFSTGYSFDHTIDEDTMVTFDWAANASAQFPSYPHNDSTFGEQVFKNYYAYDDGTAEKAYGVFGEQAELAYKFNIYQPDELIAVQMHFVPTVVDVSNNLFLLAVWDDDNGKPGDKIYEDEFFFPQLPVYAAGRNVFRTYFFNDFQKVSVGETFYVGWRQIDEDRMNIGFDMNHDNSDKIFWSVDGGNIWHNANFEGSLMMRPVISSNMDEGLLGYEKPIIEDKQILDFDIYPNPTRHSFKVNFDLSNDADVIIQDLNGRVVQKGRSNHTFDVSQMDKGIYLVSLIHENVKIGTKKLVIN